MSEKGARRRLSVAWVCSAGPVRPTPRPKNQHNIMPSKREFILTCSLEKFKRAVNEKPLHYNALATLRGVFTAQETLTSVQANKLRFVQRKMQECIDEGKVSKRRVPGTGERVEVEVEYKNTPENRKRGRVGQKYTRTVYKDAEYVEHKQKKMRRARVKQREEDVEGFTAPVRRNFWIEAMAKAKANLGTENFVVVYKEVKDPKDEQQVLGHKVYLEARRILEELRAEDAKSHEKHMVEYKRLKVVCDPVVVDEFLAAKTTREFKKLVMKHGPACYQAIMAIRANQPWEYTCTESKAECPGETPEAAEVSKATEVAEVPVIAEAPAVVTRPHKRARRAPAKAKSVTAC